MSKTITAIDFLVPIRTLSEANLREHWTDKLKRKKAQQEEVSAAMQNNLRGRRIEFPCHVTLTRIGSRRLDADNLAGSFKHVQDAIAFKLKADDGDAAKVTWEYAQMPIGSRDYAVKVSITSRAQISPELNDKLL